MTYAGPFRRHTKEICSRLFLGDGDCGLGVVWTGCCVCWVLWGLGSVWTGCCVECVLCGCSLKGLLYSVFTQKRKHVRYISAVVLIYSSFRFPKGCACCKAIQRQNSRWSNVFLTTP